MKASPILIPASQATPLYVDFHKPSIMEDINGEMMYNLTVCLPFLQKKFGEQHSDCLSIALQGLPTQTIHNLRNLFESYVFLSEDSFFLFVQRAQQLIFKKELGTPIEQLANEPAVKPPSIKTYLLFDTNSGYYKIGRSRDILQRERTLRAENPNWKMVLVMEANVETALHHAHKHCRLRGEWFDLTSEEVEAIKSKYQSIIVESLDDLADVLDESLDKEGKRIDNHLRQIDRLKKQGIIF